MIKFTMPFLMLMLLSTSIQDVYGQTVYYQKGNSLMTELQMDSVMKVQEVKARDKGLVALKDIKSKEVKGDSIIYHIALLMMDKGSFKEYNERVKLVGNPLPSFKLQDIDENTVTNEDFKGKPLVMHLWFTACAPCVKEIPELNKIKSMSGYSNVNFVAVTFDDRKKVLKFLNKNSFDFKHIVNAKAYCKLFTNSYPLNIFVDRNGIITDIQSGFAMMIKKNDKQEIEQLSFDNTRFIEALNRINVND